MHFKIFVLPFSSSHLNFLEQRLRGESKSQDDLRHSRDPASYQIKGTAAHSEGILTFLFALSLFTHLRDFDACSFSSTYLTHSYWLLNI